MSEPAPFLALGDSYTIGEGVTPSERWPVRLARALTAVGTPVAEPRIVARTGWTVAEMLVAMEREGVWPDGGRHALVTLLIGVNDQYRGLDPSVTLADHDRALARAVTLAGDDPARVVAISIPDWGATPYAAGRDRARIARELDALNAAQHERVRAIGAHWVDVTAHSRRHGGDPAYLAEDLLHPGGRAYAEWADALLPTARAALAGRSGGI